MGLWGAEPVEVGGVRTAEPDGVCGEEAPEEEQIKVDVTNYNIMKTALTERPPSVPMEKGTELESVSIGDTGASVTCSGISLMQDLGGGWVTCWRQR